MAIQQKKNIKIYNTQYAFKKKNLQKNQQLDSSNWKAYWKYNKNFQNYNKKEKVNWRLYQFYKQYKQQYIFFSKLSNDLTFFNHVARLFNLYKINKKTKYYYKIHPFYNFYINKLNYYLTPLVFYNLKFVKFFKRRFLYKFYLFKRLFNYILEQVNLIYCKKNIDFNKLFFLNYVYKKNNLLLYKRKLKNILRFKTKSKYIKYKIKKINKYDKLIILNYLINNLTIKGKKKKNYNIFFNILLLLKYKYKTSIFKILYNSVCNVKPLITFKTMYIGGKKYKIPVPLNYNKSYKLALKWIVQFSKDLKKKNYILNLLNEILDSSNNIGNSIKKRKEFHLLAYENKSYIRFLRFLKS